MQGTTTNAILLQMPDILYAYKTGEGEKYTTFMGGMGYLSFALFHFRDWLNVCFTVVNELDHQSCKQKSSQNYS